MEDRIADIGLIMIFVTIIVLKVTNVITIPWVWLLSPIWILFLVGCILAVILTIMCIIDIKGDKKENERN